MKKDSSYLRLSKLFSEKKITSRRSAEKWIENQWVQVNGQILSHPGEVISPRALIMIDPKAVEENQNQVSLVLNKPPGYVCSFKDPKYRHALSLIHSKTFYQSAERNSPYQLEFKDFDTKHLAPAGRLDAPSRGLVIYTQDGSLAKSIIGPQSQTEKEYLVQVKGQITPERLKLLRHGLSLDGRKLKPAQVQIKNPKKNILSFILKEGRNRQIRRMCQAVHLEVLDLFRIRIGDIHLADLPEGRWHFLKSSN